jgi:hypothetical protein
MGCTTSCCYRVIRGFPMIVRFLTVIGLGLWLSGCVVAVVPHHRSLSVQLGSTIPTPKDPVPQAPPPSGLDATVTCALYQPPPYEAPPGTPDFTAKERSSDRALAERLTQYIEALRQYLDHTADASLKAYQAYLDHCPTAKTNHHG